ncbi:hypothetical protein [Nocardia sp. NPDC005745]|uniref:hypothetical protein n=1 Tax=Nocardia sp. NPDC005745 TaxID=3157061 RepID=UPI00340EE0A4
MARLDGVQREIRLLVDHRDDLVAERTHLATTLRSSAGDFGTPQPDIDHTVASVVVVPAGPFLIGQRAALDLESNLTAVAEGLRHHLKSYGVAGQRLRPRIYELSDLGREQNPARPRVTRTRHRHLRRPNTGARSRLATTN